MFHGGSAEPWTACACDVDTWDVVSTSLPRDQKDEACDPERVGSGDIASCVPPSDDKLPDLATEAPRLLLRLERAR